MAVNLIFFLLITCFAKVFSNHDVKVMLKATFLKENNLFVGDIIRFNVTASSVKSFSGANGNIEIWIQLQQRNMRHFDSYSFKACDGQIIGRNYTCKIHENNILAYFNVTSTEGLSQSSWKVTLILNKAEYDSNIETLPKIHDPRNIHLTLNGQLLTDKKDIILSTNTSDLKLCCKDGPQPCLPLVSSNKSHELLNSSECVVFRPESQENKTYTFGYKVRDHENQTAFTVNITYDNTIEILETSTLYTDSKTTKENDVVSNSSSKLVAVLASSVVVIIFLAGVIAIIFVCKRKSWCCFEHQPQRERNRRIPENNQIPGEDAAQPLQDLAPPPPTNLNQM